MIDHEMRPVVPRPRGLETKEGDVWLVVGPGEKMRGRAEVGWGAWRVR
jgi:hypothetical protein